VVGVCEYLPFGTEMLVPTVCHVPVALVRKVRFIRWFWFWLMVMESGGFRGWAVDLFCGDSAERTGARKGMLW